MIFNDGSGFYYADENLEVDAIAAVAGGRVDGRGAAANDELIYAHLATLR